MWIRHAGNDLVLDKIEKDLDDLTDRPSTPSPFWLLATSDSSRAITLLDAFLGKFPEWKAAKLGDLLHNEHLVSKTAWKYITDAIGQYCDSVTVDWNGIYAMEFFDFRPGDDPEKYIREFSWSVLDSLANIYLDNLLHHEDFTRIMLVGEYRGNLPDTLSTQGMLYGIYPYVDLLRFCERYGIRKQIEPLQDALEKFERALFDRRLRWPLLNIFFREKLNWPLGRGGALSGPDYKTAVKVYKEQKAAALKAMASRE
jgi:hypothetical protein